MQNTFSQSGNDSKWFLTKIIFQNRYVALETGLDPPPPFMANAILNFHFDFLHTSLIYNHGPSIESNECLSPKSITMPSPQNVAIVKVYSPVYTQLTWTSVSVGTWRFCLIGLQASWQVCICICASVCVSVCPIYGGNLLALWTSPTCAAVETLIQATNNSNFQVGNQQTRNCALYMV